MVPLAISPYAGIRGKDHGRFLSNRGRHHSAPAHPEQHRPARSGSRTFRRNKPIGLVLAGALSRSSKPWPCSASSPSSARSRYLQRIVVVLARATQEQFDRAGSFFHDFYTPVTVIWMDSDRIQALLRMLEERGLSAGPDGKGRSCWLAYGYLLAMRDCGMIALHDCDIVNYDRQLLARLCYAIAHPHLAFEFCKGYYARVTDRMHGRVTRLFMTPLIRAHAKAWRPATPFLHYPGQLPLPAGRRVCHGHRPGAREPHPGRLGPGSRRAGRGVSQLRRRPDLPGGPDGQLRAQAPDAVRRGRIQGPAPAWPPTSRNRCSRTLAAEGVVFTADHFRSLEVRYVRMAAGHHRPLLRRRHAQRPQVRPSRRRDGRRGRSPRACAWRRPNSSKTRAGCR